MAILAKWPKILVFFFVIFIQDDAFFILVEFESDRISPRESAKNERTVPIEILKIWVPPGIGKIFTYADPCF